MKISLKKFFILLPAIFFAAQLYAQKTIGPFDVFVSAQNKKPDTLATGTKQGSADEGRYIDIGISNIKGPIKISPTQFTLQGPPCPTYSNGKRTPATPPPPATKTFGGAVLTDKANIPAPGTTAPAEFTAKDNGYWTKCSTGKKTPYDTTVIVKLNVVSIKILLDKHVAGVCQYNRGLIDVKSKYPDQGGAIKWTSRTGNCKIDEIWNGMRCAFEFTKGNSDVLVCTYTVGKASYYDSCVIKKGDLKWVKDTFRFWAIRGDSVDCKPLVTTSGNINNVKFKSFAGLGRANGMNRKTGKLDANFGESFIVEAEDTTMPGCTATALFEFYSLKIKADDANKCDGLPAAFHLEMKPHDHASMWAQVTNVTFTSATSVPSKGNPGNKTKLDFEAYNAAAHTCKVKNMWWYSTAANNCNDLSTWIISGTASGGGKAVPIAPDNISADAGGTCDNGSASVTQTFTGEPTIDTTYNETTRKWEVRVTGRGTFRRNVTATTAIVTNAQSQYYAETVAEENYHVEQLQGTKGDYTATLYNADSVYTKLTKFFYAGNTKAEATALYRAWFAQYLSDERLRSGALLAVPNAVRCKLEREAKAAVPATYHGVMACTYPTCR